MKAIALFLGLVLYFLPAGAMPQDPETDEAMQRDWLSIQANIDREATAAWWRSLDRARLEAYIQAKVDVDYSDRSGWTPLHSAARYNSDPGILTALLRAGASVDARNRSGDTPLHWAAADNANADISKTLIEAGAHVNATDKYGWLPIHTAADRNPNPEVISLLAKAGSKLNRRAYWVLFRPRFLLKHNSKMSDSDKDIALQVLSTPPK